MIDITLSWLFVAVGIVGLLWSADRFVAGSAAIASNLGLPKIVIGLTIVSFGTSAPEILVSINASIDGHGELAIGNALGSNIANLGLVLAITALVAPIPIKKHIVYQELPILLLVTTMAGYCLYDAKLVPFEGILLLSMTVPLILLLYFVKKRYPDETVAEHPPTMHISAALIWFVVGLGLMIFSAKTLVNGAENIALYFGVSPLIVGLTVVAIGTSLPELAASVISAIRGHHDIALGNVIGSNIFNLLLVMAIPGLFNTGALEDSVFKRDFLVTALLTLLLGITVLATYISQQRAYRMHLNKSIGSVLLLSYVAYLGLLTYQTLLAQ